MLDGLAIFENHSFRKDSSKKGLGITPTKPQLQVDFGFDDYRRK